MSIQCPTCEKNLPDDARFCRRCGRQQSPPIPSISQLRNNIAASLSLAKTIRAIGIFSLVCTVVFGVIQGSLESHGDASAAVAVVIGICVVTFIICLIAWMQQTAHVGRYIMQLERLHHR